MVRQMVQRQWERAHGQLEWHDGTFTSWAKEYDAEHPFHRDDGVTITVSEDERDGDLWDRLLARSPESPGDTE